MNIAYFIAARIALKSNRSFSRLIIRIAIIGIMLSLSVMILSVGIIKGFKNEISDKVRGYLGDIRIFSYDLNNSFESTPFVPSEETIDQLTNNKDILFYQRYATKPGILVANGDVEGLNLKGVDKEYNWDFIQKNLKTGSVINFKDTVSGLKQILISSYMAKRLKLKVGDHFLMHFVQDPPKKRPFTVVGIYEIGVDVIDKSFAITNLEVIRRVNNWDANEIGGLEVRVKDFNNLSQTTNALYKNLETQLQAESVQSYYPGVFVWLDLLDVNTQVLLALMLIVGIINMVTALLIMILERTNMIGLLKAFGSTNREIMKIFLLNASYLIGFGLLLGNVLGLGLAFLQQYTHVFKLPEAAYFLSYVPVEIHFTDVVLLNAATAVICLLVLLIPSLLISKISPLRAIRFK